MHIGIIGGTGPEGRGLAARLASAGLEILLGSRDAGRARDAVERIRSADAHLPIQAATNDSVVESSGMIFLAVPFTHAAGAVESYRHRWRPGTVIVDLTVPLTFVQGVPTYVDVSEGSAAEHLRARLPPGVRVAAALKTIPAWVLERLDIPLDCDEFVCGDSPEARAAATEVLGRIPALRLLDAGGLESARALERMTLLLIGINKRYRVRTGRFRVVGV
jgi:NADPH-dependent F420 reductase